MRRVLMGTVLAVTVTHAATAQVGHPPSDSPYRDIDRGHTAAATVGYLSGSRGRAEVGPSAALTLGVRYELRLSGPTDIVFSLSRAGADRFVIDPLQPPAERRAGPVSQSMVLGDVGLHFLITGSKTWNGLAPYVGASFGVAVASSTPQDTSGYEFGTKFTIQPMVGVRYYPTTSVSLRLEIRDVLWRLRYPGSFFGSATGDPEDDPVLAPGAGDTQWTHHPWLTAGIGIAFRL